MNWEQFQDHPNKLGNLYNVVRISDGKHVLRGATYNKVVGLVSGDEHLYRYFIY